MKADNEKLLAGCIVLYNPPDSVITNILTYLSFVEVLYVIDNSDRFANDVIDKITALDPKIVYRKQEENIGVAAALNVVAELAINQKYDWLLTMDQDSFFIEPDFFDTWYTVDTLDGKIGLIAASYTNQYDRWQKAYSENYNEIHFAVTSGNIISLKAWQTVGGFEEKLFIDEVDHDYCLKLRKDSYLVLTSKKVLMGHIIGEIYENGDDNSLKKLNLHSPVRYYYISRNVLYMSKKYFLTDIGFVTKRLYYLIKRLVKILLRYPDKKIYLRYFFRGIGDFIASKYNRYNH